MGGDFSGKNQDCSKGIYALAGSSVICVVGYTCARYNSLCVSMYEFFLCSTGRFLNAQEAELQEVRPSSLRHVF